MEIPIPFTTIPTWCEVTSSHLVASTYEAALVTYDPAGHQITFFNDNFLPLSASVSDPHERDYEVIIVASSGGETYQ